MLKKYFIPHADNNHRPRFLEWRSVVVVLAFVLLVESLLVLPSFLLFPRLNFLADVLPAVLTGLTNNEREAIKLPDLATDPRLTLAAQAKAANMAARGYFAHNDPATGAEPWAWLGRVGYQYDFAGENLAVNFIDSTDVVRAWMASPTHRDNIVRPAFTQIGIGVASGIYQGRPSLFVVQFFGRPSLPLVVTNQPGPKITKSVIPSVPVTTVVARQPIKSLVATVKGESTAGQPTFWQKLLAEPRTTSAAIFSLLVLLVSLALVVNILVHIRIQHPDLIANGLAVICLLGALLFVNNHLSRASLQISNQAAASAYLSTP